MKLTKLIREFIRSERSGGIILICCTIISMLIANSFAGTEYRQLWENMLVGHSIKHWINDGLMTIFFLLIGLELERELYHGELANPRDALLPVFAAIGGMLVPAAIYLSFNYGTPTSEGAGIPIATDIAFALGILTLLGKRVPNSLKVFLITLAIIDDLGAIMMIATFYTDSISWINLGAASGIMLLLAVFNYLKIKNLIPYLAGGAAMWYFMHQSGVHATITGVILAFLIPFRSGEDKSPSCILQHHLHKPVAFFILPLFALVNTAIVIAPGFTEIITRNYSLGIFAGLVLGKPAGIIFFTLICLWLGLSKLPQHVNWLMVCGAGFLGGIGFTMSVFITMLAFTNEEIINNAKLVIVISSVVAGLTGYAILKYAVRNHPEEQDVENEPSC